MRRALPVMPVLALSLAGVAVGAPADGFTFQPAEGEAQGFYALSARVLTQQAWSGETEARIVFDLGDDGSCHTLKLGSQGLALGRIRGGRYIEMEKAPGVRLPKEFDLAVYRRQGYLSVLIDGRVVLRGTPEIDLRGRVGSGTTGRATVQDLVVQPLADPDLTDDFTRGQGEMADWETLAGQFENTVVAPEGFLTEFAANPFALRAVGQPVALARWGEWFWDAYSAGVSFRPTSAQAVALCFFVKDSRNYLGFRWRARSSSADGAREIIQVVDGAEKVLASEPGGFVPGQWYRLAVQVGGGSIRAMIDRSLALVAQSEALAQGPVGILAAGGEAFFDDVTICPADRAPEAKAELPAELASDPLLSQLGVYSKRGLWGPNVGGAFWHSGLFTADVRATVPLSACGGNRTAVILRGDGAEPTNGYQVAFTSTGSSVMIDLTRSGQPVQQVTAPASVESVLVATVDGGRVEVRIDNEPALVYEDAEARTGRKVGMIVANEEPLKVSTVESSRALDTTFANAPTDWVIGKGEWGTDIRWPCDRRWAFFGGHGDENPTIWSKQAFAGEDVVVETFAAIRMDLPYVPGYSHPSDLGITLCGNGRDLGSGYSFTFAGFNNTKSALFRQGQLVAEAPGVVFQTPVNTNLAFQRTWFRLRAEKVGSTLRFSLDGNPVLQYEDPDPLPGGQVALWSYRNGPILARVRTWFESASAAGLPPIYSALPETPKPYRWAEGTFCDFETTLGEWHTIEGGGTRVFTQVGAGTGGTRGLKVTNTISGGAFAAYATVEPFAADVWPEISLDYAIPADVHINLYAYARGAWHAILLTGGPPADNAVKVIGQIEGLAADGQWHHATFGLHQALSQLYPGGRVRVAQLAFASPEMTYLRCGIGGNPEGSSISIDNFRLGAPQAAPTQ